MQYIALFRGINVGGNRKVEMKKLKAFLESLGYKNVSTYLNSGNALFESTRTPMAIQKEISKKMEKEFGFEIPTLIKTSKQIKKIAANIPRQWQNGNGQKTDVAYLFDEMDSKKIIDELPIKLEYVNIRYVPGALIWNIDHKFLNKSQLHKLIGHKIYKFMTLRNVNTARFLAGIK